ncbi:hypothetical protein NUW54_g30 [Trametes sanguinea]|uniref:Uncharacterized protein n=1 Tax=Trametes sanguinea TaxID=158606 RepID=A0ACC1QAI9_9APHY|nr:hypothetical protein NUW54_g30 [Trametes sanguinea]
MAYRAVDGATDNGPWYPDMRPVLYQDGKAYAASVRAFDRDVAPGAEEIDWEGIQASVKLLAICGEEDVMMAGTSKVAAMLSKSTIRTLNDVGHTPTVKALGETARLIEAFVEYWP